MPGIPAISATHQLLENDELAQATQNRHLTFLIE